MTAQLVELKKEPSLENVVERLRYLADQIEVGEHGNVDTVFVVIPVEGDYPRLFGFGDVAGTSDPVMQLELAKIWLLQNLTARS